MPPKREPRRVLPQSVPRDATISEAEREIMHVAWEELVECKREVRTVDHLLALMRQCNVQPCGQEYEYRKYFTGGEQLSFDDFYDAMCEEKLRFHHFKNSRMNAEVDLSDAYAAMGGCADSHVRAGREKGAKRREITRLCTEFDLKVDLGFGSSDRSSSVDPTPNTPYLQGGLRQQHTAVVAARDREEAALPGAERISFDKFAEMFAGDSVEPPLLTSEAVIAAGHAYDGGDGDARGLGADTATLTDAMKLRIGVTKTKSMWGYKRMSLEMTAKMRKMASETVLDGRNTAASSMADTIRRREEACMQMDLGLRINKKLAHRHHEGGDTAASIDYLIHLCRLMSCPESQKEHNDGFHYRPRKGSLMYATQQAGGGRQAGRGNQSRTHANGLPLPHTKPTLKVRTLKGGLKHWRKRHARGARAAQSPDDAAGRGRVDYVHPLAEGYRRMHARPNTAEDARERLGMAAPPDTTDAVQAEYQRRALENYHHVMDDGLQGTCYVLPFQNQLQMPQHVVMDVLGGAPMSPWGARPQGAKGVSPLNATLLASKAVGMLSPPRLGAAGTQGGMAGAGSSRPASGTSSRVGGGGQKATASPRSTRRGLAFARKSGTTEGGASAAAQPRALDAALLFDPNASAASAAQQQQPSRVGTAGSGASRATTAGGGGAGKGISAGGEKTLEFVPLPPNWDTTNRREAKFKKDGTLRPGLDKRLYDHYFGFVAPPRHAAEEMAKGAQNMDLVGHGLLEFFPRTGPLLTSTQQEAAHAAEEETHHDEDHPLRPSPPPAANTMRRPTLSIRPTALAPAAFVNTVRKHGMLLGVTDRASPVSPASPGAPMTPNARSGGSSTPQSARVGHSQRLGRSDEHRASAATPRSPRSPRAASPRSPRSPRS